jgi:hypothetical protein
LKIALFLIYYNNRAEIERLVNSIPKGAIDVLIAIDGIFLYSSETNPNLPEISTDGSRELLINQQHKFTICLHDSPKSTEFQKRNKYLELCEHFGIDVGIVTDSDEYFIYPDNNNEDPISCWNKFKKNLELEIIKRPNHNVYGIRFLESDVDTYKPRIWVKPAQMRYLYNSHYMYGNIITEKKDIELFKQNKICYTQQAMSIIKGITLAHDHTLRDPNYLQRRKEYQQYLTKFEELVQSHRFDSATAHKMAKQVPSSDFSPS